MPETVCDRMSECRMGMRVNSVEKKTDRCWPNMNGVTVSCQTEAIVRSKVTTPTSGAREKVNDGTPGESNATIQCNGLTQDCPTDRCGH